MWHGRRLGWRWWVWGDERVGSSELWEAAELTNSEDSPWVLKEGAADAVEAERLGAEEERGQDLHKATEA